MPIELSAKGLRLSGKRLGPKMVWKTLFKRLAQALHLAFACRCSVVNTLRPGTIHYSAGAGAPFGFQECCHAGIYTSLADEMPA